MNNTNTRSLFLCYFISYTMLFCTNIAASNEIDKSLYNMRTVAGRKNYWTDVVKHRKAAGKEIYQFQVLLAKDDTYFDEYLANRRKNNIPIDFQDVTDGEDAMTMLFEATMYGYHNGIKKLLAAGANPLLTNTTGESALTKSLSSSDKTIQAIFKETLNNCNVTATDKHGESILSKVIQYNNHNAFDNLKNKITPMAINQRNLYDNCNLTEHAVTCNNPIALTKLIALGGKYKNKKCSITELACDYDAASIIHAITDSVSDDSQAKNCDLKKLQPFHSSLHRKNTISGKTPIMTTLEQGKVASSVALLRSVKDLGKTDNQGNTLLHYTAKQPLQTYQHCHPTNCNADIAKVIIDYTNIDACNDNGENPMFDAVRNNLVDLTLLFKTKDMNRQQQNKDGKTSLIVGLETAESIEEKRKKSIKSLDKKARNMMQKHDQMPINYELKKKNINNFYDKKASSNNSILDILRDNQN